MTTDSPGSSSFTRWWWIATGAVLLILIAAGGIVFGVIQAQPDDTAPSTSAPAPSTAPTAAGTGCDVPGASDTIPTTEPETTWEANVYFLYPTSSEFGPFPNPASDRWGCFPQSPTGALFAAANFYSGTLDENYAAFAVDATVDDAARQQWLNERAGKPSEQGAGRVAQIAGFQYQSVTDTQVTIALGFRQEDVEASMVFTTVWDAPSQNWKIAMAETDMQPVVANMDAFTPWSAG